jgi:hypothetical protein
VVYDGNLEKARENNELREVAATSKRETYKSGI